MTPLTLIQSQEDTSLSPTQADVFSQSTQEKHTPHFQLLGAINWLMLHSPLHRFYSVEMIETCILPSLLHEQFRYYEVDGTPIGFINWSWLSESVESQFQTGQYQLQLEEWNDGDRLWFPEFIAPFGHARQIVKDLRRNVFQKKTPAKALRIGPDGKLRAIAHYVV